MNALSPLGMVSELPSDIQTNTAREADDLVRAAEQFVEVVAASLGLAYQPVLEGLAS